MCGRPRHEREFAFAEVEFGLVLHVLAREHDLGSFERRGAKQFLVDGQIALGACRETARHLVMGDECRLFGLENRISEDVIGMHVGVDDVADRLVCDGAHGIEKSASDESTAAGIDDGGGILADDEGKI